MSTNRGRIAQDALPICPPPIAFGFLPGATQIWTIGAQAGLAASPLMPMSEQVTPLRIHPGGTYL
jgi:hypothetical protein